MGPHVIVGAYEGRAERIHQGEVSVSTIAGSKQIPNQRLELAVPQFAIQEPNECLFFARSDIIEIINRFRLLELGRSTDLSDKAPRTHDLARDPSRVSIFYRIPDWHSSPTCRP